MKLLVFANLSGIFLAVMTFGQSLNDIDWGSRPSLSELSETLNRNNQKGVTECD